MKNRISLFFTSLILLISISFSDLSAQGNVTGNTGSWPPDYEIIWKCLDSSNLGTNFISFYEVHTLRAGTTTAIQSFRTSGASFTPPAGNQKVGDCAGASTVTIDTLREVEIVILCDDNGPFFRIIQAGYKPGDANVTNPKILGNYTLAMAAYTPVGSVMSGDCAIANNLQPFRLALTTTTTLTGNWSSYEIHNPGLLRRTVTINGTTSDIYPGETLACRAYFDPLTQEWKRCPSMTVNIASDGVNNPIHVFYRN